MTHARGFEARKGFDYLYAELNLIKNHRLQHATERAINAISKIIK